MSEPDSEPNHAWKALGELQQIEPDDPATESLHDRALEIVEDLAIELDEPES